MATKKCPTCEGEGVIHTGPALDNDSKKRYGSVCHCDGPPHQWSEGWCPAR